MKEINGDQTVYQLVKEDPRLKEILVELGFTPLADEKMLNSIGRMMTLNNGIKQLKMNREEIKRVLENENYRLKDE